MGCQMLGPTVTFAKAANEVKMHASTTKAPPKLKFSQRIIRGSFKITNLKAMRVAEGLSVRALAKLCDLSPSYLSEIETQKKWAPPETLERIQSALKKRKSS